MLAIVKFLFVPFGMLLKPDVGEQWTWIEVIIVSSTGAALGVFIFFHFGEYIFTWLAHHFNAKRKIFTRRNRWFIRIKKKYGLNGLLMISGLISVPIAAMIGAKLYRHNSTALPKLIIAFFCWSVALSSAAYGMKMIGLSF
ncbi:MAG: hypothetical protein IPP69_04285 [Flavobacteriales bacterium]|nr:hypothetical protein [Flavobacteriales bacterium]